MTDAEFEYAMLKIVSTYGDRSYPIERKNILFNQLSGVSGDVFRDACHYLIATSARPPMLQDFKEAILFVNKNVESKQMKKNECDLCDTYGAIIKIKDNLLYAFKCDCDAGNFNFSGLPSWKFFSKKHLYSKVQELQRGES